MIASEIRNEADFVVGVHIRHGDYKTFENGRYYYTFGRIPSNNAQYTTTV